MARYTDPMQLLAHQKDVFKQVQARAKAMHKQMVRDVADEVTAQVSGPLTKVDERLMGHPFARRRISKRGFERTGPRSHGIKGHRMSSRSGAGVAVPLLPINVTTGKLRGSLRMKAAPHSDPAGQVLQLGFTAEYAKYVLSPSGTKKMVARGFQKWKRGIDRRHSRQLAHDINLMALRAAVDGRV
jgi:hypothetical protein